MTGDFGVESTKLTSRESDFSGSDSQFSDYVSYREGLGDSVSGSALDMWSQTEGGRSNGLLALRR